MSNTAKEFVRSFYETDLIHNLDSFSEFFHPDILLHWNSSFGFDTKNFQEIKNMFKEMASSFNTFRCELSHLIAEGDQVTARYTYYAKTIESPEEEQSIADFITIWELKDGQLYKGYLMSQQGTSD